MALGGYNSRGDLDRTKDIYDAEGDVIVLSDVTVLSDVMLLSGAM
jgi:hypothetical protein